jgi:hypothetical protein
MIFNNILKRVLKKYFQFQAATMMRQKKEGNKKESEILPMGF